MSGPNHVNCRACGETLGPCVDGDVTVCLRCGQWHETVGFETGACPPARAAELARAPFEPYALLDAMALNEKRMVLDAP